MIASKGGASEPADTLLLGKAGGAAAVRRTLASTICRAIGPMLVARPRQLRDASPVMRFRPAHQSMFVTTAALPALPSTAPDNRLKESHEFACLLLGKADMRVVQIKRLVSGWRPPLDPELSFRRCAGTAGISRRWVAMESIGRGR
jgi:hypothetical protein